MEKTIDKGINVKWLGDNLSKELDNIREHAKQIYKENKKQYKNLLPFFVDHNPEHWDRVEEKIHELIPRDRHEGLLELERFYLLASSQLHDIGMLPKVAKEVDKEKYFEGDEADEYKIRDEHHEISALYIVHYNVSCGVQDKHKYILANIVRYHRKSMNLNNLSPTMLGPTGYKDPRATSDPPDINVRLLAAYLRIADSLDIGVARTKESDYLIKMSYDIPSDNKIHWLKSMIVNGIRLESEKKTIEIEFKKPNEGFTDKEGILQELYGIVKSDLQNELNSVMPILFNYNITQYNKIKDTYVPTIFKKEILKDLRELVLYRNIMMEPSASNLLEWFLITASRIFGFTLTKNEDPIYKFQNKKIQKKEKFIEFINSFEKNILKIRKCHLGLSDLIENFKRISNKLSSDKNISNKIIKYFQLYQKSKDDIKEHSKIFFKNLFKEFEEEQDSEYISILLFGYSELVIKALSGFKDSLKKNYNLKASEKFKIFICEGQPKTQTGTYNHLLYHDGSNYAFALHKKGFRKLILIPDITFSNILENFNINLIMVGANGFNNKYFRHHAGHSSIIRGALHLKSQKEIKWPKLVLVVSSYKYLDRNIKKEYFDKNKINESEGCYFWHGDKGDLKKSTRDHIWFERDEKYLNNIHKKHIMLYNPREDVIPINLVEYIISDAGIFDTENQIEEFKMNTKENKKNFWRKILKKDLSILTI